MTGAGLAGVSLRYTRMRDARLSFVKARGADFTGAQFNKSLLLESDLRNANLASARFNDAKLIHTDLSGTDVTRARFDRAMLRRTNLSGVDLSRAGGLTQEQIDQAIGDAGTRLPPGLTRPETWDRSVEPSSR